MMNSSSPDDEQQVQRMIEQSLHVMALQLGHPMDKHAAQQVHQNAVDLLSHIAYAPNTLARLAGTLLVYQAQATKPEEVEWLKSQVKQCGSDNEIEEVIEWLHCIDHFNWQQ